MKTILRVFILLIIFVVISLLTKLSIDSFLINTIYTVAGIMFSLGLGLVVTFNMSGVKNPTYIKQFREDINEVRNRFLIYFSISTFLYLLDYYLRDNCIGTYTINVFTKQIEFNWSVLVCLVLFFSIIYYIQNFLDIQQLNNEIFDKLNKEENS